MRIMTSAGDASSSSVQRDAFRSRYYAHQAQLRGLHTTADVEVVRAHHAPEYDALLSRYPIDRSAGKIVEVASGPGIFLGYLAERGYRDFEGIEFADGYLDLCRKQNLPVVNADVRDWLKTEKPSSVGALFAIDFAEHLDRDDVVSFFDAVARVLSPAGTFFFRVPNGDSPFAGLNFRNDITHETLFTTTATRALLEMCGLRWVGVVDDYSLTLATQSVMRRAMARAARVFLRALIRLSTGHHLFALGPTMWVVAKKAVPTPATDAG